MQIKNSTTRYGMLALTLHWVMAILMIALLGLGLYMVQLPVSLQKLKLYGWHKEFGVLVLMLAAARILWRFINITPSLSLPLWERLAARTVHWAFYGFMFALPITGWMITSAAGLPISFFGLFTLPDLIAPDANLMKLFQQIHKWVGYGLIAAIAMHTGAALKHHFIDKDDILRRMMP